MAPKATLKNFFLFSFSSNHTNQYKRTYWSLSFITPIIHICIILKFIFRVLNKSIVHVNYIPTFTQETGKVLPFLYIFLSKCIFNFTMYVYLHFCCLTNS